MNCSYRNTITLVAGFLGAFFILFWLMQNGKFINLDNKVVLLYMNGSLQGFNSLRAYAVYYVVLFLLFMNMRLRKERSTYIVLFKNRTEFYVKRSLSVLVSACLFSFTISMTNVFLTYLFVGPQAMVKNEFFTISLLNGLSMAFFYSWIGLLGKSLEDKTHSYSISVITTFIAVGLSYFLADKIPWVPIKDMKIYEALLTNKWNSTDLLFVFIRQIGLVVTIFLLGLIIIKEKDFISNEK